MAQFFFLKMSKENIKIMCNLNEGASRFVSKNELYQSILGRQLVLFGAGNIAHKTLRFLDTEVRLIFDNGGTLWGEFQEGIKICKPDIKNYDRSKKLHHNLFNIF